MANSRRTCWAIVLARGGSKTVPLKNLHELGGRPLIEYCIRALQSAKNVGRIIVSTDHPEIAAVATALNVDVHERSERLSGDAISSEEVLRSVLDEYGDEEELPELTALIQPTSPFVTPATIDSCLEKLLANAEAASVQSVTAITHHAHAINQRCIEDGRIRFAFPELRRGKIGKQSKVPHYALGNFIAVRTPVFLAGDSLFGEMSIVGCIVNRYEAMDVDTLDDFQQAEIYLKSGVLGVILGEKS